MSKTFIVELDEERRLTIPAELHRILDSRYVEISFDEVNRCLKLTPAEDRMRKLIGSLSARLSFRELRAKAETLLASEAKKEK